jgi:hypothetical protein
MESERRARITIGGQGGVGSNDDVAAGGGEPVDDGLEAAG